MITCSQKAKQAVLVLDFGIEGRAFLAQVIDLYHVFELFVFGELRIAVRKHVEAFLVEFTAGFSLVDGRIEDPRFYQILEKVAPVVRTCRHNG